MPSFVDTETHRFRPGCMAPRIVCLQAAWGWTDPPALYVGQGAHDALAYALAIATASDPLVGHAVAFDLLCGCATWPDLVPAVVAAYDRGAVRCARVRATLLDIASGRAKDRDSYRLAELGPQAGAPKDEDPEGWRLRFADLEGVPVEAWPASATRYALQDVSALRAVWGWLEARRLREDPLPDEAAECRAALALHLTSTWGLPVDLDALTATLAPYDEQVRDMRLVLRRHGIMELKNNGEWKRNDKATRALVERIYTAAGRNPPMTSGGKSGRPKVAADAETLEDALDLVGPAGLWADADADEAVEALRSFFDADKPAQFLRDLLERAGASGLIHASYNVLVSTGRTSAYWPNIQQMPRRGGIRECFRARPGHVLVAADYPTLEMRTFAQAMHDVLGWSPMADRLRAEPDADLHLELAAEWLGIPLAEARARYEAGDPEVVEARQKAKAVNFGLPGGMGVRGLVAYAKANYGVVLSEDEAAERKESWVGKWQADDYFRAIKAMCGLEGKGDAVLPRDGSRIGGRFFTELANAFFQGMAARVAKLALWLLARACLLGHAPLAWCRPVAFLHDEIIVECPRGAQDPVARELAGVMTAAFAAICPDVPCGTIRPAAMEQWSKKAKAVHGPDGTLGIWVPGGGG